MKAPITRSAGLLCITLLLARLIHAPRLFANPAAGIHVNLVRRGPDPEPYTFDADDQYTLTSLSNRKARVRHLENLGNCLRTVFSTQVERFMLVSVEGNVT